jgi:hypothetical protein
VNVAQLLKQLAEANARLDFTRAAQIKSILMTISKGE